MNEKLQAQKEIIAKKKERLEKKEKLLKEKERKLRTKKLIELGSLIEKVELDRMVGVALFGALLEIKEKSKNNKVLNEWQKKGEESLKKSSSKPGSALAISFPHSPPEAILKVLREKSFKWNRFRKEWYGYGTKTELEEILKDTSPKIEILS